MFGKCPKAQAEWLHPRWAGIHTLSTQRESINLLKHPENRFCLPFHLGDIRLRTRLDFIFQVKILLFGARPKLFKRTVKIHTNGLSTRDRQLLLRHDFVLIDSHMLLAILDTTSVLANKSNQGCSSSLTSINMRLPKKITEASYPAPKYVIL